MQRYLLTIASLVAIAVTGIAAAARQAQAQPLSPEPPSSTAESSSASYGPRMAYSELGVASASSAGDAILIEPVITFGMTTPHVDGALGLGVASAALLSGKRRAITLTPSIGRHLGWDNGRGLVVQLYALARSPIQWRTGAGLGGETGYGLAAELGARLWSCSRSRRTRGMCVGLGVGARYRHHLTEFQMDSAVLPAGSSVLSLPVSVTFAVRLDQ